MAEPATNAEQTPESRLYAAGFSRRLELWCPPGSEQAFTLEAAIAKLDAGEIEPPPPEAAWPPGYHPETAANFRAAAAEMDQMLARSQAPPDPPPLPEWADPWAELVADKLKPVIRAEVRAALRAESRRRESAQ